MSKHTPGPWTAFDISEDIDGGAWERWSIVAHGPIAYGGNNTNGTENSRANAALIAAAPDLLEALTLLLQADDDICENRGSKSDQAMLRIAAIDMARAAIAKAQPTNAD